MMLAALSGCSLSLTVMHSRPFTQGSSFRAVHVSPRKQTVAPSQAGSPESRVCKSAIAHMGDRDTLPASAKEKVSCIPHFDALWFCYSPAYQLRHYYIWGNVDDCQQHWSSFWNCLKLRTKFKDQVAQVPDKATHPVFQDLRSKAAAEAFWRHEFAHLNSEQPPPADHDKQPTVASSTQEA